LRNEKDLYFSFVSLESVLNGQKWESLNSGNLILAFHLFFDKIEKILKSRKLIAID